MTTGSVHLAVDLGASSGRILASTVSDEQIQLEEVHRFDNGPIAVGKRLHWDLLGLWQEIELGLSKAGHQYGARIESIGVDSWGVDYQLLDRNDDLVGPAFNYRDPRTAGILPKLFTKMSREAIFQESGLQFMEINSLSQLVSMRIDNSPLLDVADRFLMIADFFHWMLSGEKCNEYTNASTTQLLRPEGGTWSAKLMDAFDIPNRLFSEPIQPATLLGPLLRDVASRTRLPHAKIVVPATHDTGAAVLAVPAIEFAPDKPTWCYISSGTWSLMGVEVPKPNLSKACLDRNFTNEGGALGSTRLLKNITGLWPFQQCRAQWKRAGTAYTWAQLEAMAASAKPFQSLFDPDDPRFTAPHDMPSAIQSFFRDTNQNVLEEHGAIARSALEGLALRYRICLGWLEELLRHTVQTIHVVGGGVKNRLLCQMTADACGREVIAGPIEATAIGNVVTQAIGLGYLSSIQEARELVRTGTQVVRYEPSETARWDDAWTRFETIMIR